MSRPLQQRELTLKQKLFAKNYLANGGNATQAALKAGYSENSICEIAFENLRKPQIQEYIAKAVNKTTSALEITFEWKLQTLKKVTEISLSGDESGKLYPAAAVSAISELNKMQGDHAPVKIANLNMNVDASLEDVHELINLYQQEY